jgi:beta-glucosidase
MNAITLGRLDRDWNGRVVHRPDLAGRLDFVGVNYYVRLTPPKFLPGRSSRISSLLTFDPLDGVFDRNAPDGLLQVLREESRYGLPIYVTETGCDAVNDEDKPRRWLLGTLAATRQALHEGIDVRGYFYWTLMDNYEWNHGTNSQFGLFQVDPKDEMKRRIPRSAVSVFRDVTSKGLLP